MKLKQWHMKNDKKKLKKSGTTEENNEVDQLLGEYVQLEREVTESQTSEKKRKLDKERALVEDGKRIRDSAMGVFSRPGVTKSKGSPSSDLATALTMFLQH